MDEKDRLILFELMQNCRQPLHKIAKVVGLPKQTVDYRIKKLEEDKVITKWAEICRQRLRRNPQLDRIELMLNTIEEKLSRQSKK